MRKQFKLGLYSSLVFIAPFVFSGLSHAETHYDFGSSCALVPDKQEEKIRTSQAELRLAAYHGAYIQVRDGLYYSHGGLVDSSEEISDLSRSLIKGWARIAAVIAHPPSATALNSSIQSELSAQDDLLRQFERKYLHFTGIYSKAMKTLAEAAVPNPSDYSSSSAEVSQLIKAADEVKMAISTLNDSITKRHDAFHSFSTPARDILMSRLRLNILTSGLLSAKDTISGLDSLIFYEENAKPAVVAATDAATAFESEMLYLHVYGSEAAMTRLSADCEKAYNKIGVAPLSSFFRTYASNRLAAACSSIKERYNQFLNGDFTVPQLLIAMADQDRDEFAKRCRTNDLSLNCTMFTRLNSVTTEQLAQGSDMELRRFESIWTAIRKTEMPGGNQ